jgi:diaminopimelate decarboxylase
MNSTTATAPTIDNELVSEGISKSNLALIAQQVGTPVFIYNETQLLKNIQRIKDAVKAAGIENRAEFYVPFFPNSNPHILKPFQHLDIGLLLQLPSEYELLRRHGFNKFIVSTGHLSDADISFWAGTGYPMFLSSMDEIEYLLRNHRSTYGLTA